jgi:AraC-like DNA-binding protein
MDIYSFIEEIVTFPVLNTQSVSQIVLPDNSIHMAFYEGHGISMDTGSTEIPLSGNYLCGHLTSRKHFFLPEGSNVTAIKFKSWANSLIFGINLYDIIDQNIPFADFLPDNALLPFSSDQLDTGEKITSLLAFLNRKVSAEKFSPGILNAICRIENSHGNLRVNELADQIGYSRRNLERRFKEFTGITIKKFINNTRFQFALMLLRRGTVSSDIIYACGYFDQAHFIEEFKNVTGVTPGQFIKKDLASGYYLS